MASHAARQIWNRVLALPSLNSKIAVRGRALTAPVSGMTRSSTAGSASGGPPGGVCIDAHPGHAEAQDVLGDPAGGLPEAGGIADEDRNVARPHAVGIAFDTDREAIERIHDGAIGDVTTLQANVDYGYAVATDGVHLLMDSGATAGGYHFLSILSHTLREFDPCPTPP